MKYAFTTTFNSNDVENWSGTPFYMAKGFEEQGIEILRIDHLKRCLPPYFKLKQFWKKISGKERESTRFNPFTAQQYSLQVAEKLSKISVDAVVTPLINPVFYLDCKQPLVLWTDA